MALWIARDKDGELYLYNKKPYRRRGQFSNLSLAGGDCCKISDEYFNSVTWKNSPKKVELKLNEE